MLTEAQTQRALRLSIYDGAAATVMSSLAGGIFVVGFALNVLGASSVQTGILSAMPVSANIAQLLGAIWIETFGRRRVFCISTTTVGRLMWVGVIVLALPWFDSASNARVWWLMVFVGLASFFGSIAGVAWLEWISDVIPEKIRGTYLARRNIVSAAAGMVATLAAGVFMDAWNAQHSKTNSIGYALLFAVAIVFGLVSSWFLVRTPDPKTADAASSPASRFSLPAMARPFLDGNFRRLVVYAGAFTFATQLAGPFYNVFMIDNLGVPLGRITWFLTAATLASLVMWKIWGAISDTMGNKPVLTVAGIAYALVPFVWLSATPERHGLPLALAQILTGAVTAATALAQVNILVKLAPVNARAIYIAVFNAANGIAAGAAPIIGGWLVDAMKGVHLQFGCWSLGNLTLLFLISGALQLVTLLPLLRVQEVGAASPFAVLMQLRNDLDPRTGISSVSDFVLLRRTRAENVLARVDRTTDEWIAHNERRLNAGLDALGRRFRRPASAMRRFLEED
jgi:MFS family permease